MKTNLKIGIDLDNVLAEFMAGMIDFYNKKYGTTYKEEDFKHFELHKTWGGTLENAINIVHDFYFSDEFEKIIPVTGSQNALAKLSKENDLFVITARPHEVTKQTIDWLDKYFPNMFKDIIITNLFSMNNLETKTKPQVCDALDIDVFVDDSFHHVLGCVKEGRKSYLYNAPWNENDKLIEGMERVFSWEDILEKLK